MKKILNVGQKKYSITGLSEEDPYFGGIAEGFEDGFKSFCRSYLEDDFVALDVGANIGATAIILGHLLSKGQVHAFEPGPTVFKLLKTNIENSGLKNVFPQQIAASDKAGTVPFAENSAYGHIDLSEPEDKVDKNSLVEAETIDKIVDKLKLKRLDFIKIDVEGFEPQVLKGAKNTIKKFNPIIYFELNTWCLTAFGKNNAVDFMSSVFSDFKFVTRVGYYDGSNVILEDFSDEDRKASAMAIVHDNITKYGSVNDIVVTNTTALMDKNADRAELSGLKIKIYSLEKDLKETEAEAKGLRIRLDAMLNSSSWRITALLRRMRGG